MEGAKEESLDSFDALSHQKCLAFQSPCMKYHPVTQSIREKQEPNEARRARKANTTKDLANPGPGGPGIE